MASLYPGRLTLSMVVLAGAGALPGQDAAYRNTASALEQYRVLAAEDDGAILPSTQKPVEPGGHYAGVPRLTRLLSRLGDLPAGQVPADSDLYGDALATAVKGFQARHGLEPDGRIGPATLAQLNTPLGFRIRQLELALERWRRMTYDSSRPAIVLNLPEFRLRAFNAGANQPELDMKVVVGRARKLKTPLLSSELDTIIFRPYWNVPRSILRNELAAEIIKDPAYISKQDFELVTPQDVVVAEETAGDEMLAQLRSGKLRLRQRPGPENALGLVKFMFPNEHNVYMHDTPARSLFAQARRDFSHGCIRLEKPADLAEWVLRKQSGWPRDRIVAAMQGTESIEVKLRYPLPVVTMYVTAVVGKYGKVHFFQDIYGEDAVLETEMAEAEREAGITSVGPGLRPRE